MTHKATAGSTAEFLLPGETFSVCPSEKKRGDVIILGQDSPEYTVVHVEGDLAWIENERDRHFAPVNRLRKVLTSAESVV